MQRFVSALSNSSLAPARKSKPTRHLSSLCSATSWEKQPGDQGDARSQLTRKGKGSEISPPGSWRAFLLQGNRLQHCGMRTWRLRSLGECCSRGLVCSHSIQNHKQQPRFTSQAAEIHPKCLWSRCSGINTGFCTHQEKKY